MSTSLLVPILTLPTLFTGLNGSQRASGDECAVRGVNAITAHISKEQIELHKRAESRLDSRCVFSSSKLKLHSLAGEACERHWTERQAEKTHISLKAINKETQPAFSTFPQLEMRLIQINLTPKKKKKKVPTYPKHTRKQFQLVKQEESEAHRLANEKGGRDGATLHCQATRH